MEVRFIGPRPVFGYWLPIYLFTHDYSKKRTLVLYLDIGYGKRIPLLDGWIRIAYLHFSLILNQTQSIFCFLFYYRYALVHLIYENTTAFLIAGGRWISTLYWFRITICGIRIVVCFHSTPWCTNQWDSDSHRRVRIAWSWSKVLQSNCESASLSF